MNKKYSKIFISILASGLLLAGVFFIVSIPGTKQLGTSENIVVESQNTEITKKSEIDTDNDGLLDWEETLWNTDPRKSDTDGDKTLDGAEVKSGRNPAVAGPKDTLNAEVETSSAIKDDTPLTPTEKLGRNLFLKYMTLKQSGQAFDETTINLLVEEIMQDSVTNGSYRIYTASDVTFFPDQEIDPRTYGNSIAKIVLSHAITSENELVIFGRFVDSGNVGELKKLDPLIASYEATLKEILEEPIPKSGEDVHLALVNGLSLTKSALETMKKTGSNDPLIAYLAIEQHQVAANRLIQAVSGLKAYFKLKSVVFKEGEYGYQIFHGV